MGSGKAGERVVSPLAVPAVTNQRTISPAEYDEDGIVALKLAPPALLIGRDISRPKPTR